MAAPAAEISATASSSANTPPEFPRFDVIADDPSDHFYFKTSKPGAVADGGSGGAYKKIMQEWKLLDGALPESIFVRVYESRISLLRAAIVGAPGTPYHDCLFFFDISLPYDYPNRPPQVHYMSFGFRINPNLYDSGRVCLSLLNTWGGTKSEKWDRNRSTILQVLLSIQALVLNEKPYFNEPGYGSSRGKKIWEKKAMEYNQETFVLCCKSTLCLLRRPPRNFESLVRSHYKERSAAILTACNVYRRGEVSGRFRAAVEKVYGDLVDAFAGEGFPVGSFAGRLAAEREKAKERMAKEKEKRKKNGSVIRKRIMGFLEKIWGGAWLKSNNGGKAQV